MAAATREATPPPIIGKAGRYTVFITPPAAPKTPSLSPRPAGLPCELSPSPSSSPTAKSPPPVQVPPLQFEGKQCIAPCSSVFGLFWDAVAKVQDAHSRLDEYLAHWLGLNQSKYQWAVNDYYESKPADVEDGKSKDLTAKGQRV
ncbi:hydroxyproline-rich glycoprotein family protein [Wolffia australiana]